MPALFVSLCFPSTPVRFIPSLPPFLHARVWCNPLQRAVNPCLHKLYLSSFCFLVLLLVAEQLAHTMTSSSCAQHFIPLQTTRLCLCQIQGTLPSKPAFQEWICLNRPTRLSNPQGASENFGLILSKSQAHKYCILCGHQFPTIYYARINCVIVP